MNRRAIACPEEVAFRKDFIAVDGISAAISACHRSKYRTYIEMISDSAGWATLDEQRRTHIFWKR